MKTKEQAIKEFNEGKVDLVIFPFQGSSIGLPLEFKRKNSKVIEMIKNYAKKMGWKFKLTVKSTPYESNKNKSPGV